MDFVREMNAQVKEEFSKYSLGTNNESEVEQKSSELLAFIDKV